MDNELVEFSETAPDGGTALEVTAPVPAELAQWYETTVETARELASRSVSQRTLDAYQSNWNAFVAWCQERRWSPLPADPEHVGLYVADLATRKRPNGKPYSVSTIAQHLAAINFMHKRAEQPTFAKDVRVQSVMEGLRRDNKNRRPRQARPLLAEDVKAILATMKYNVWPDGVAATRDAFLLLCGFVGAFRRSEPVSLNHGDVTYNPYTGLRLYLAHSKTDQHGDGATIVLPFATDAQMCVVCAYIRWSRLLELHVQGAERPEMMRHVIAQPKWEAWKHICREGIPDLPDDLPLLLAVFRGGVIRDKRISGGAFGEAVQRRAADAGYSFGANSKTPVSAHSLRAGFVTQARMNGADVPSVQKQTRHKRPETVTIYDRGTPETGNAVNNLGL